ncbi:hypothetical protein B9Z51_06500 [Limnohabitans sp. T6-5]|uniref:EpsG family protein n=1 Tax=Limnohabitans sp. T6-5 TaxID=1100724 RepID=UPI000D3B0CC1|nr:EpsG family protein [Limnohabitans sp. T6-5]PUE08601.1 hypothetical protein B9Z51_06500 [Limnohabitans sp. T6-5]
MNFKNLSAILLMMAVGCINIYSVGGMDLSVYDENVVNFNFTEIYFLKEIISWLFIILSKWFFNDVRYIFIFAWLLLFYVLTAVGISKDRSLCVVAMACLTPYYYLMSLNVLRQLISAIFLSASYLYYVSNKKINLKVLLFIALSILSHNSVAFLIMLYVIIFVVFKINLKYSFLYLLSVMFFVLKFQTEIILFAAYLNNQEIVEEASDLKRYIYIISQIPFVVGIFKYHKDSRIILISLIVTLVNIPLPNWMIERLLITSGYVFFITYLSIVQLRTIFEAIKSVVLCFGMLIFTFFHTGVKAILFGEGLR